MLRWKYDRLFMMIILFISTFLVMHVIIRTTTVDAYSDFDEVVPTIEIEPVETDIVSEQFSDTYSPDPIEVEEELENIMNDEEEIVEDEPVIHVVSSGESLWSISNLYYGDGSKYNNIKSFNNLYSDMIVPNQELSIPNADYIPEESEIKNDNNDIEDAGYYSIWHEYDEGFRDGYSEDTTNMTYLGEYFVTGYDPFCAHCCGGSTKGITASGNIATVNRSASVANLPFGTELYVEGYGFVVVEDRGAGRDDIVDIARISHEACGYVTRHNVPVYVVNK